MVQVLPSVPGFGEQLAQSLGQAGASIGQGLLKRRDRRLDENIINQLVSTPNLTPVQKIQAFAQLSPDGQQSLSPLIQQFMKMQPSAAGGSLAQQKFDVEQQEKRQEEQSIEQAFKEIEPLIEYGGTTVVPGFKGFLGGGPLPLNREAVGKREELKNTGFFLADKAYNKFNKGTVTDAKLEMIKRDLAPHPDNSDQENRARIRSLKRVLALPSTAIDADIDKAVKGQKSEMSKMEKGTKITDDVVDRLLKESGFDAKKAEAKARNLGYEF